MEPADKKEFVKVLIPVLRNITVQDFAAELVSVQPMTVPYGANFTYAFRPNSWQFVKDTDESSEYFGKYVSPWPLGSQKSDVIMWCCDVFPDPDSWTADYQVIAFAHKKHVDWFLLKWTTSSD